MARATWNETVIAESDKTVVVEGTHYFPLDAVRKEFLQASDYHTNCYWKGDASYYNLVVNGQTNDNGAWYYPQPLDAAKHIAGHVAFWKGVKVEA